MGKSEKRGKVLLDEYLICNFPRLILNLFEHLLQDEMMNNVDKCGCKREPPWFTILCSISHFLLTFNSSANFIIYGSTEEKFKKTRKFVSLKWLRSNSILRDTTPRKVQKKSKFERRRLLDGGTEKNEIQWWIARHKA